MSVRITMADKILQYRHKKHLSQFDFAEDCGISDDCLSLLENGAGNPRLDTMEKIAERIGIPLWELMDPNKQLKLE